MSTLSASFRRNLKFALMARPEMLLPRRHIVAHRRQQCGVQAGVVERKQTALRQCPTQSHLLIDAFEHHPHAARHALAVVRHAEPEPGQPCHLALEGRKQDGMRDFVAIEGFMIGQEDAVGEFDRDPRIAIVARSSLIRPCMRSVRW